MIKLFLLLTAAAVISCNQKKKGETTKEPGKKTGDTAYTITKEGIGEIKIGMTQGELEKLLKQELVLKHAKDTEEVWSDTATAKYKDMEVSLYFQKQYNEDESIRIMELYGVNTSSPLCKTESGLGVGAKKADVLAAYDDSPVNMGPEYEQVNDSTWAPNKTKFYINILDDKYDKQLVFKLVNKKVASIEANMFIGE
jgi:hypothetical protein